MTLHREGWSACGRPYAVMSDPETGESLKFVCLDCMGEIEADRDVFEAHDCENYREGPELRVTESAEELAEEAGVDLGAVDGTGKDGRITKADVESVVEEG